MEKWIKQKERNQEHVQKMYEDEKYQHCTFQPMTEVSKDSYQAALRPDYTKLNTKSIEKFLGRQIDAR